MMKIIIDLLLIAVIVTLIYDSGFFEVMDDAIQKKWRFHHLPHVFHCRLCGTWWLTLIYIIATGQLSLLNIAFCIAAAYTADLISPMVKTIQNIILKVIEIINRLVDKI